jgi:hypothetical protein
MKKTNKRIILILALLVVFALTTIFILTTSPAEAPLKVGEEKNLLPGKTSTSTTDFSLKGKDSLEKLLARGENLECELRYQADALTDGEIKGTFFTSRNRLRGDFMMNEAGVDIVSSMILTGEKMYTWSEIQGQKYGMEIPLASLKVEADEAQNRPATREVVPTEAAVDYECKNWTQVDGQVFEPPSDVIFKNYDDLMQAGMEFGNSYDAALEEGTNKQAQCDACAELPIDMRGQCLMALACE